MNKINLDLRTSLVKELDKVGKQFIKFTKTVWFKEITNDEVGIKLYRTWQETLDIDESYDEIKSKYSIIYKNQDLENNQKLNKSIAVIITISLIINVITFMIYRILR